MSHRTLLPLVAGLLLHLAAFAQSPLLGTFTTAQATPLVGSSAYEKYITRSNFCTLTLDNLLFSESLPGRFMLDLKVSFNSDISQVQQLRILFDDVLDAPKAGDPLAVRLSGISLSPPVSLAGVTSIDLALRLVPVVDGKFQDAYALLGPILGKPLYGVDVASIVDKFAAIASAGDKRSPLLFRATIPVPQNVIEAQKIDAPDNTTPPLQNNRRLAIQLEGSKEVTDQSIVGKAKDVLNGVATLLTGQTVLPRPTSSFKGMVTLRFNKDPTQALPDTLIAQLKDLSDTADQTFTADDISRVKSKADETIKTIEAAVKAKQLDTRADFHLRNYVDMTRLWAIYRKAASESKQALRDADSWQNLFRDWYNKVLFRGAPHLTQVYAISDIYSGRLAKIFIPYSLTDDMTLELIQRQISLHQSLADLGITSRSEPR